MKKRYEDKISVLEHQNNNLKDELFYLRAAILAQYEAREQVKASHKWINWYSALHLFDNFGVVDGQLSEDFLKIISI